MLVGALLVTGLAGTAAAVTTIRVTGDTVDTSVGHESELAPDGGGWWFGRDASTWTPYEFNFDAASIGTGSLYVPPITNLGDDGTTPEPSDRFIAELFLFSDLAVLDVAVGYLLGPNSDANQVYVNVYATDAESDPAKFYD